MGRCGELCDKCRWWRPWIMSDWPSCQKPRVQPWVPHDGKTCFEKREVEK
jgi:hypothetical protein